MLAQTLPSGHKRLGRVLPVLFLSASCALFACAGSNEPSAADPDREHSQGAPLQSSPNVTEQRISEPVRPQTRAPAQQPDPAPQAAAQRPPQIRPMPAQTEVGYITLQPGETLSYISALYAVSEKDLIAWNGLNSAHDIRAGQRLAVRPPATRNAPPVSRAESAPDGTILVISGQSLSGIAMQYGVTVAQLREWNGLTSDTLHIGQRLRVQAPPARSQGSIGTPAAAPRSPQTSAHGAAPSAPDADGMITVQPGQTLSGIAAKYKVSTANLRQWNKLQNDRLQNGQKLRVQAPVRVHTVKEGESLGGIAAKYKVSTKALMQRNKLANADVLPVGKELLIP